MSEISTTASKLLVATKITAARDRIAKDFHQHYALADKGHREDHFRAGQPPTPKGVGLLQVGAPKPSPG